MKKIIIALTSLLLATACAQFTELQPKGKNLLSTADELELLLNYEFSGISSDFRRLTGDMISYANVANELSSPTPSRYTIMLTWDQAKLDKFNELTSSDSDYSELCGFVGKIANPILNRTDEASGDETKKKQLKAEAYTLRAYSELLTVNKFAAAYDPSTAANTPGVPYLMEDWDISEPTEQWTVGQVYDQIIADCDAAIALNALPVNNINRMRFNKACPYAIKALALMCMQKFDEAESAANSALSINGEVTNYLDEEHTVLTTGYFLGGQYPSLFLPKLQLEEDYFHTYDLIFYEGITQEALDRFEEGHAIPNRIASFDMAYDYTMPTWSALSGIPSLFTYDLASSWNTYGLKTTQMYLILAECAIRKGNLDEAMRSLDVIRVNRIDPTVYTPLQGTISSKSDAIIHLKQTAHGEGIFTPWNFVNRKRWNQLDDMRESFTRDLLGTSYTLSPDSKLWIFPFPKNAMNNNVNLKYNNL